MGFKELKEQRAVYNEKLRAGDDFLCNPQCKVCHQDT